MHTIFTLCDNTAFRNGFLTAPYLPTATKRRREPLPDEIRQLRSVWTGKETRV